MTYRKPLGLLLSTPIERITPKSRWLRKLEFRQEAAAKARATDDAKVTPIRKRAGSDA